MSYRYAYTAGSDKELVEDSTSSKPVGGRSKRIFDIIFASHALAIAGCLLLILMLTIRLTSRGPVVFSHERIGHGGRPFKCFKLRTMRADADAILDQHLEDNPKDRIEFERERKLKNDPRIIPFVGQFLRRTSLDELPQFINVLKGDMSVVGPRPVTAAELDLYGPSIDEYLSARPGITGLWQISGRNLLSFPERVKLDRDYVRSWSLHRDFSISLKTAKVVLFRHGAY